MGCSMGCSKCSPIVTDRSENVPQPKCLHLFDLSDDVLRYILRFLPKGTFYVSLILNIIV